MTKIIFFDTDCISSFLWTKSTNLLKYCFGRNMIIPVQVYEELSVVIPLKERIDELINDGFVVVEDIPNEMEYISLYLNLTSTHSSTKLPLIGKGEAASILLTKRYNGVLATNNLRDALYYVKLYKLEHITTAQIIHKCVSSGYINIQKASYLWKEMIFKKRKLPFNSYKEYVSSLKNK